MNIKKISQRIGLCGLLMMPIACSQQATQPDYTQTSGLRQELSSAKQIVVDERVLNLGKDYDILVNGRKVGTVSGKDFNMWADTFTLKTLDGQVLASEKEDKRILAYNRSATIYDGSGRVSGYLTESRFKDLFSFYYKFHILDEAQQEIAVSEKLTNSYLGRHKIVDTNGRPLYDIDKHFTFIGDKYTITVFDSSRVPVTSAILMTCIEDAIGDSQSKDDGNKKEDRNNK